MRAPVLDSSQGQLQVHDIHELDVEVAAQVLGRQNTGGLARLQGLALQLHALCQLSRVHLHHLHASRHTLTG